MHSQSQWCVRRRRRRQTFILLTYEETLRTALHVLMFFSLTHRWGRVGSGGCRGWAETMATAQLVAHTAHERALLILFASPCSALPCSAQTSRRRRRRFLFLFLFFFRFLSLGTFCVFGDNGHCIFASIALKLNGFQCVPSAIITLCCTRLHCTSLLHRAAAAVVAATTTAIWCLQLVGRMRDLLTMTMTLLKMKS